jgi:hypothetical protein
MKSIWKLFVLVLLAFVAACNSGGGGGGGSSLQELDITVSGTFSGGQFTASVYDASPTAANQFLLTGKLDDGVFVYALTGTYNSETGRYILGAASADVVYNIRGEFDEAGTVEDIEMGKIENDGSGWASSEVTVTPAPVTISNAVNAAEVPTLPSHWAGNWQSFSIHSNHPMWMVMDPVYGLEASIDRNEDGNYTTIPEEDVFRIVEVRPISATVYEIVVLWGRAGDDAGYGKIKCTEKSANSVDLQLYEDQNGKEESSDPDANDLTILGGINAMTR